MISDDDPRAVALVAAIHHGDLAALAALLHAHPALAAERFGTAAESRTALHLVTDWPARRPAADRTIATLVAAGAEANGRFVGAHRETPLHWAASADDVVAIDALVAAGADLEADGGVLTDGTPLADAVVFAQWAAARRLVALGATMTLWQAAALGEVASLASLLDVAIADDIDNACWHACRAGEPAAVDFLVAQGADLDRVGHEQRTAREMARASGRDEMARWLAAHDEREAHP